MVHNCGKIGTDPRKELDFIPSLCIVPHWTGPIAPPILGL